MAEKRNNLKTFFRAIKVIVPLIVIATIVSTAFAWFGVNLKIHAIFGHSLLIDFGLLAVTYSDAGRLYFTEKFRFLIYMLVLIAVLELAHCIYPFHIYIYYNIALFTPLMALVVSITSKIIQNDKRNKKT